MSDDLTHSVPSLDPVQPGGQPLPTLEPVRPAPPPKKRSSSGRWLNLLLGVAAVVAIGGVAFAVGRSTAPAQAAAFPGAGAGNGNFAFPGGSFDPNQAPGGANGGGGFGGGLGFGGVTINGSVDAVSADSITITTAGGQQVTLSLTADTSYHSQSPASASDVTVGSTVAVQVQGAGGFPNGANGNGGAGQGSGGTGNGNGGAASGAPQFRGSASDVTVIPQ